MTKPPGFEAVALQPFELDPSRPTASSLIGQHVGNYVIDRPLARGGMGEVFVAKHPRLGREVAVKFLDAEISSRVELSQRFLSEAQVTASLNHPNIVDILDFGELDGRLYYVMELLRGQSLATYMAEHARFTVTEALNIIQQICSALEAAHGAGVVHRDLKPDNIIVMEGAPLRIKLVDFGVAKLMTTSGHTRNGQVLGTPSHMAPEQAMGDLHLITPQTDLYSLGVIAFEMLTGSPPFQHESEFMLMIMHVRDPVPRVADRAVGIPPSVAGLIESCLAKAPRDRPGSARQLGEQLSISVRPDILADNLDQAAPKARLPHEVASLASSYAATLSGSATESRPQHATQAVAKTVFDTQPMGNETALSHAQESPLQRDTLHSVRELREPDSARHSPAVNTAKTLASLGRTQTAMAPVAPPAATLGGRDKVVTALLVRSVPTATRAPAVTLASPARRTAPESHQALELHAPPAAPPALEIHTPPEPQQALELHAPPATHTPPAEQAAQAAAGRELVPAPATGQSQGEATLEILLARLQRRGDFPAFAQSVGEVSVKADPNGAYSAGQLGESILKDYALTAKLLRLINSTYAGRFKGKIYSIRHAIVLLGFDRIRSLALGISLFKSSGKSGQSEFVSDSSVASIVSGEIARNVAAGANVNDEEAMVCAMFRNLGRHLAVVYLPEYFERIRLLSARDSVSERVAAERVLGTSFSKLGTAIAQNWHLPQTVISAIAAGSSADSPLITAGARSNAVAEFANDLCEIIASAPAAGRGRAVSELLAQHRRLISLDEAGAMELVANVEITFQQRYSAVLGLDAKASRFLCNVAAMKGTPEQPEPSAHETASTEERPERPEHSAAEGNALPTRSSHHDTATRAKPVIAPLALGRSPAASAKASHASALDDTPLSPLELEIEKMRKGLAARKPADALLTLALNTWKDHTGLGRILVLAATAARDELTLRFGLHDDLDSLAKELRFSLKAARGSTNVFQVAFAGVKDVVVADAFSEQGTASVPLRYYEVLGSPAFALYACSGKGRPPVLLLAELENSSSLPSAARLAELASLRPLIAEAAAGR